MTKGYKYVGWVPCLSGDMFFRYTEPGLGDSDIIAINHLSRDLCTGVAGARYIAATSIYDWKDSGDPNDKGVFRAVVTGKVECQDEFSGAIYFISSQTHDFQGVSQTDYEESLLTKLFQLKKNVLSRKKEIENGDIESESEVTKLLKNAVSPSSENDDSEESLFNVEREINKIHNKFIYIVKFSSSSDGITRLEYDEENSFKPKVSEERQKTELSKAAIQHHKYILCRQGFYYLKYLLHRHTHHEHYNDSLTTTHIYDEKNSNNNARDLIRDLKRGLVDLKRAAKFDKRDMAGIATYGKSLVMSCYRRDWFPGDGKKCLDAQLAYFSNLSESIRFRSDEHSPFKARLKSIFTTFQQALSIAFLFITPVLLIAINKTRSVIVEEAGVKDPEPLCTDIVLNSHTLNQALQSYFNCAVNGSYDILFFTYLYVVVGAILLSMLLGDGGYIRDTLGKLSIFTAKFSRKYNRPWYRIDLHLVYIINVIRIIVRSIRNLFSIRLPHYFALPISVAILSILLWGAVSIGVEGFVLFKEIFKSLE